MGTKKLVKAGEPQKTVQQPDLSDRLILFERWLVNNWRKVAAGAGIVMAALIIWGVAVTIDQSIEDNAEEAFANAKDTAEQEALLAEYGDSDAANFYRIAIAADAIAKNDFDKAIAMHREIADSAPDSALKASSIMTLAALYEKKGELAEAVANYAEIAADDVYAPAVRTEAAYQAGRIALLQNNSGDARMHLESAITIGSGTMNIYADMAKQLLRTVPEQ